MKNLKGGVLIMKESLKVLPEPLDRVRRTLAQEVGDVLTGEEFQREYPEVVRLLDFPTSVQDVLCRADSGNRVRNKAWLPAPHPVSRGSKP